MYGNIFDRHFSPENDHRPIDLAILKLMLDSYELRPWALKEIATHVGDPEETILAMRRLHNKKLVAAVETYVLPTRPVVAYHDLQRFAEPNARSLTSTPRQPTP